MKIKFTKNDFTENGGKLFLNYLDILNQWESDSVGKTLKFNPSRRIQCESGFKESPLRARFAQSYFVYHI